MEPATGQAAGDELKPVSQLLAATLAAALLTAAPVIAQDTASSAATAMPSIGSVLSTLPSNVHVLPTLANAAWLGGAGALSIAVHENDPAITEGASGSPNLEGFLDSGSPFGSGFVQGGGALGTYVIGRLTHRPQLAAVGGELLRAQIINGALTQGIKFIADRERPDGGRYSFPSGHTSSTFASATVLYRHFGWKAGIPGYALAAYVAGSRLSENAHFLSDVLFGAGIGIVSGRTVTAGRAQPFEIAPAVGPGVLGVSVTIVPRR